MAKKNQGSITNADMCLHGKIKIYPEDFLVEEAWDNRIYSTNISFLYDLRNRLTILLKKRQDYLHFTLVKRKWNTIKAVRHIAKRLHVSLKRFGYSGMKDKNAITAQRISAWKIDGKRLLNLKIKDLWIKDIEYSNERINLGEATGNRFTVVIRQIPINEKQIRLKIKKFSELVNNEGIPNFFGPQRIGRSGDNVKIGQAILNGDLKLATDHLLHKIEPYINEGDIQKVPDVFWPEKAVYLHLMSYPNDYAGALRRIPKKLLRIFTHSVQSKKFNDELKEAIIKGNIPETIEVQGFKINKMPELSTRTISRRSYIFAKEFKIIKIEDGMAKIQFILDKGQYATAFISNLIEL